MGSPFGTAMVIAGSEAGRFGRDPGALGDMLRGVDLDFELSFTRRRGSAQELARTAIEQEYRYLIAVGGDPTIHEVVNGMMGERGPRNPEAVLGILPAAGSDLIRTFGLPSAPQAAVTHLAGDNVFQADVGRLTYASDGGTAGRWFANIAEAGLGGDLMRRAQRLPRSLGRVRYLLGFWTALAAFSPSQAKVALDDRTYEGPITNLVVANAQFFRGGMRIAPKAHPSDGKFDVLIMRGTKRDYVAAISKAATTGHLPSPAIREHHAGTVEITAEKPLRLEADGEPLGVTPARFEVVAGALRLKV